MDNILAEIIRHKRQEVNLCKSIVKPKEILRKAKALNRFKPPKSLRKALIEAPGMGLIAEIKKASPSKGILCENFNPEAMARAYTQAGASALSVLTDGRFFGGSLNDFAVVRRTTNLPLLRKEFMIDPYQIFEARAMGADAILLIVAALKREELLRFQEIANELGMEALVEVHDEEEMEIALEIGSTLIGINNRNLKTFQTDINTTIRLADKALAQGVTLVSESGIKTSDEVACLKTEGIHGILVGEALVTAPSLEEEVKGLLAKVVS